jgi:tetratricopeptide (TPR) repeat protein
MMRALVIALAVVIGLASAARADQNDPRLGPLFASLKATKDPKEGARITHQIWALWFDSDRPAVKELIRRGQVHLRLNRIAIAAALFDRVVKIAPNFAEGWNRRATVRYLQGDYEGSLRDIERTLKLEPRHFGALSGRGLVLVKLGRDRAALAAFRQALAINPHLPAARINIRILLKKLGEKAI